jgi:hypothetical protein
MALTDQKSTKTNSTTTHPKHMIANTAIADSSKKNGLKLPPVSQHRAVLCLRKTILLFEMQAYSSRNKRGDHPVIIKTSEVFANGTHHYHLCPEASQ